MVGDKGVFVPENIIHYSDFFQFMWLYKKVWDLKKYFL